MRKALHKFRRVNKIKEEANRVHEASGMHQIKQIQGQHQKEIAIFEFLAAKNIKRIENYSKIAADRYFQTKDGIRTLEVSDITAVVTQHSDCDTRYALND